MMMSDFYLFKRTKIIFYLNYFKRHKTYTQTNNLPDTDYKPNFKFYF